MSRFQDWLKRPEPQDWLMVFFTAVIAVATICYVVISGRQLNVLDNQVKSSAEAFDKTLAEMKKQTGAMKSAAESTEKQVIAAKNALEASINASRLDQRAWVIINVRGLKMIDGEAISSLFKVTNLGKTPATGMEGFISFLLISNHSRLNFEQREGRIPIKIGSLVPNEPMPKQIQLITRATVTSKPAPTILTPSLRARIESRELLLVFFGRLEYRDVFGNRHWVQYCATGKQEGEKPNFQGLGLDNENRCVSYNAIDNYSGKP